MTVNNPVEGTSNISLSYSSRVAAHTDEISDILKSRIFHTDTATVSNFTSIYTEIHEKCHKKFVAVSASEVLTCV